MFFKFYSYYLERQRTLVARESHYSIFRSCRGPDSSGEYAPYRGKADSLLMHVRGSKYLFTGLIGRHSEERDVTVYDPESDEAAPQVMLDDDYPHAMFVCVPEIQVIACTDNPPVAAQSAMRRLHAIVAHRAKLDFVYDVLHGAGDLGFATRHFSVVEVTYETLPVNPHTGDLGRQLDESNKRDHIRRSLGKFKADSHKPLALRGGHLSQVHDLQRSGHARVGYTGITKAGDEISIPKPRHPAVQTRASKTASDPNSPELRLKLAGSRPPYPLPEDYVQRIVDVVRRLGTLTPR